VILDASWSAEAERARARAAARARWSDIVEIRCEAPAGVARRRIDDRAACGRDASEATPEIARRLAADADPWPASRPLDTDRPLAETVAEALRLVG
jgi:hypothetical protein